ncbi:immunity 50 family protein [Acidisphaera sp. L21]|uniref:immunity 50 family protein n=1 Tax=Acidisphaera sp. L21 TaxID=1641851 RepID=UPI001C20BEA9|nr:immunity 50 family protein [Acidisphaera sp. L21]
MLRNLGITGPMLGMVKDNATMLYNVLPGGPEVVRWFNDVPPTFHDAEVLGLHLNRKGESFLRLYYWIMTPSSDEDRHLVPDRHAVFTFTLTGIMDLQLEGFSVQNVLFGLTIRPAPDRPERSPYLSLNPLPQDIEVELQHCFGLSGLIRARSVSITFAPGEPSKHD